MHRIWANDLPDNCIDDMEALHLAIILICNFLQFVAHFKVWKGCQEARGVAETSQSGESGGPRWSDGRQKSPLAKS